MALPAYLPVPNVALIADDAQRDAIWRRWLQQFAQRVSSTSVHNNLSGLQGGTTAEYYHLTAAQHALVTSYAHNNLNGLQGGQAGEYYHLTAGQHSTVTSFGTFTNNRVLITGPTSSITTIGDLTYTIATSTLTAVRAVFPDGLATLPSVRVGDEENGFYSPSANTINISLNAVSRTSFNTAGVETSVAAAGVQIRHTVTNTDNTNTGSHARFTATVGGTSGGDALTQYIITGAGADWATGVDNSDSDNFKISQSTSLGTNDYLIINTSGLTVLSSVSTAGNAVIGGGITVTSTATLPIVDIDGGNIDSTAIGANAASTGVFTNVSTTTLFSTSTATLPLVNIDGGNIDSTAIGAATASTGVFTNVSTTTLFSSSTATLLLVNIDGGNIDSTTIGANTASNAVFTNVSSATVHASNHTQSPNFFYESQTLNDDQAGYWTFSAAGCFGMVDLAGNVSQAGAARVWFRVGNSILCRALSSSISAGSVVTSTGPLTGTSGTDGNFTISTTSTGTGDRLYIENRTGGVRAYGATFNATINGIPTSFTIV